jgi:hypothetical protein
MKHARAHILRAAVVTALLALPGGLVSAGTADARQAASRHVQGRAAAATATRPVFVTYYLWWTNLHWHDRLGPNYPYSQSPSPLPATLGANGCGSVSRYSGNKLTDVSQALAYDQDKPGVIEKDVRAAVAAGVTGFEVNWKGDGTTTQTPTSVPFNRRLQALFDAAHKVTSEGTPFKIQLQYQASATTLSTTYISNDLKYFLAHYGTDPALDHTYSSKPEVTWTGSWKYSDAAVSTVSHAFRPKVFLLADEKLSSWDATAAANFDGDAYYWSSQDPYKNAASFGQMQTLANNIRSTKNPDGSSKVWIAPFAPGYNPQLLTGSSTCVPRNGTQTIHALFDGNLRSNPDGWNLISWNEIAEGTYVVPLTRWGNTYLDALKTIVQTNQ